MSQIDQVLVTRNLKAYKQVSSELGSIQARFISVLASPDHIECLRKFGHCLPKNLLSHVIDEMLLDWVKDPPLIALVQGNVDPVKARSIFAAKSGGDGSVGGRRPSLAPSTASTANSFQSSSTTNGAGGGDTSSLNSSGMRNRWTEELAPEGIEKVIFLSWALQDEIDKADKEGEHELVKMGKLFALANLIYEMAHSLYERHHAYSNQASLNSLKNCSVTEMENFISQRKANDVGIKLISLLLGFEFERLTFADGNTILVKSRLAAPHPPLLNPNMISHILAGQDPSPDLIDCTAYGPTRVGATPVWRDKKLEPFTVAKVERIGETCCHGETRFN